MNNVSADGVNDQFSKNMIQVAIRVGLGVKLPAPKAVLGKYLVEFVNEAKNYVQSLQPVQKSRGRSLLSDGLTKPTRMNIINFIVYSDDKVIFLDCLNAIGERKKSQIYSQSYGRQEQRNRPKKSCTNFD